MIKKLFTLIIGLALLVPCGAGAEPVRENYESTPFWLDGQTIPNVLLVLERDWKMFYPAYNNLADLDGDGALDIGFNPNVTYVGYFDSDSCYSYVGNSISNPPTNPAGASPTDNYFIRAGETTPQTPDEAERLAAAATGVDGRSIKDGNLSYPASKHGVCPVVNAAGMGNARWHGNWLNFAMTSRMDAIRKVLYGGTRQVDDPGRTLLEMIYVPPNGHVWGGELYADDLWEEYAPSSPWYDISLFTGFAKPAPGRMHFWARASYYWSRPLNQYSDTGANSLPTPTEQQYVPMASYPLFRFVANLPSTRIHPFLKTPLRIWDWVGDHTSYCSLPYDGILAKSRRPDATGGNGWTDITNPQNPTPQRFMLSPNQVSYNFAARVEVCKAGNISPTEGCRAYGDKDAPYYKPSGLLQEYGESEKMFFGLLTGSIPTPSGANPTSSTRFRTQGGVLRHHIQPFFGNYVNKADGTFIANGLMKTIDALTITGFNRAFGSTNSATREYTDGTQAGNPLGEMVWEALRYMAGLNRPTSDYLPLSEVRLPNHQNVTTPLPLWRTWADRPSLGVTSDEQDCPKPIILAISEVFPDNDGDNYTLTEFNNVKLMSTFPESVPTTFNMNQYLDIITAQEKLSTTSSGKQFFYPDSRGLCTAKDLGGLKDIVGHCPSEPSLNGSYSMAAVAYYAHTHNFGPMMGRTDQELNVDFYAVGIAGNFPDITITVDDERSLSVMPFALARNSRKNESAPTFEPVPDNELKTLLNFFIQYWQTDDGPQDSESTRSKVPFKVKFSTNFEFTTTPCYTYGYNSNNWERDIFTTVTITLLTTSGTPEAYRESVPQFINSGPFKTDLALWNQDKRNGQYVSQPYYYAFKKPPRSTHFDIVGSGFEIAGVAVHSDLLGSGYGAGGLGGYTISGVTYPGAYADTGLYRADYPLFYRGNSISTLTSFVPGIYDEPVPLDPAGSRIPGAKWGSGATLGSFNTMHSGTHYRGNEGDCGFYHPSTMPDPLLTPAECPFAGFSATSPWNDPDLQAAYGAAKPNPSAVCGTLTAGYPRSTAEINAFRSSLTRYAQVRSFKFATGEKNTKELKNPMWLAAKYGGFRDYDGNGLPNLDSEWKRGGQGLGKDDPYNYFGVANMSQLPEQLGQAFEAISSSVGTGTANSSSLNTVLGGGLAIQTQYRTRYPDTGGLTWVGSVSALFMDKWGNFRADTNKSGGQVGDKSLQLKTSTWNGRNNEIGDLIVHQVPQPKGLPLVYLCRDPEGDNNGGFSLPTDRVPRELNSDGSPKIPSNEDPNAENFDKWNGYPETAMCEPVDSMDNVPAVWNAAEQLADKVANSLNGRTLYTYLGDHPADGTLPWSGEELSEFKYGSGTEAALHKFMGQSEVNETRDLVSYIRGQDFDKYRSRTAALPWGGTGVWPMGDILNSKPVIVGDPSSRYHINYGDKSFSGYASGDASRGGVARRRQVVYFGSNSGVLHAVNLGYFGSLSTGQAGYSQSPGTEELGEELWGYIPTAVLPHLQWLADPAYRHSYYADLTPNVVDIKNSRGEWRTVLVVGLRLGGNTIELVNDKNAISYSEYFALDVTDPERPPIFLWRFSAPYLGLTTSTPAVVRSGDDWYIVLPSGPTSDQLTDGVLGPNPNSRIKAYAGTSTQKARVFIVEAMTGRLVGDPNTNPNLVVEEDHSFFNDTYLPKAYDVNVKNRNTEDTSWSHHVVYLGLSVAENKPGIVPKENYGAVYRLQMANSDGTPRDINDASASGWRLARMINTDKPVTGAVNSTRDNVGNQWVVFGTGRTWDKDDLIPCGSAPVISCCDNHTQYIYGLKEPLSEGRFLTFQEIGEKGADCGATCENTLDIVDVSEVNVYADVDANDGYLDYSGSNNLGYRLYSHLLDHMVTKDDTGKPVVRGYKRKLATWSIMRDVSDSSLRDAGLYEAYRETTTLDPRIFELINTQPQIVSMGNGTSNTAVTVYQTTFNMCDPLGQSYLYLYDTYTGLPSPAMKDYTGMDVGATTKDGNRQMTGVAYIGKGLASQATVTYTEDGIKFTGQGPTSKGEITAPGGLRSLFMSWREVMDMEFEMDKDGKDLYQDLL